MPPPSVARRAANDPRSPRSQLPPLADRLVVGLGDLRRDRRWHPRARSSRRRRLLEGRPISQGGRDHSSHRLVAIGLLWFGVYNVALNAGERRVDAGTAAMLIQVSPVLIALPFKLMLFVLADGWNLLLGSLAASFVT